MNSAKIVSFDVTFLILSFFITAKKVPHNFVGHAGILLGVFLFLDVALFESVVLSGILAFKDDGDEDCNEAEHCEDSHRQCVVVGGAGSIFNC